MRLMYSADHGELHSEDDEFQLSNTAAFSARNESSKIVNFRYAPKRTEANLEHNVSTLLYYHFDFTTSTMLELLA